MVSQTAEDREFLKPNLTCCLLDDSVRCREACGSAHYSQRIKRRIRRLDLRLKFDSRARHNFICDFHKRTIQMQSYRPPGHDTFAETETVKLAFHELSFKTLCKYKRLFGIVTPHGVNKPGLAEILFRHFKTIPVDQESVLRTFLSLVHNRGNNVDQRNIVSV